MDNIVYLTLYIQIVFPQEEKAIGTLSVDIYKFYNLLKELKIERVSRNLIFRMLENRKLFIYETKGNIYDKTLRTKIYCIDFRKSSS